MIRITVNPKYEFLREYIVRLPGTFENEGVEIYSGRNLIKVMTIDGLEINVKRYGIPALINRLVYSSFRMSKGKRAFTYPSTLLQKGFETPEPIAYIEERENNLIGYSYFISLQSPYKRTFYEFGDADVENCRDIVIAFARYTASLHEAGILHQDYSPGNILFDEIDGEYHFSLVDINRMRFGKVSIKEGCANFARLWG
ncbi:MAG: lipopolysaccharide kinase InaA family protein, partial [Bacteroides sp.]